MRDKVIGVYIFMLRTAGAYAAAFSVIFFATLATQGGWSAQIALPALGNLLALGIAAAIAIPPVTPERLTPRAHSGDWLSLILPLGILPFLFVLPSWTAVDSLGFGPELTLSIATLASAPVLVISVFAWLLAIALHFWSERRDDAADGAGLVPAE